MTRKIIDIFPPSQKSKEKEIKKFIPEKEEREAVIPLQQAEIKISPYSARRKWMGLGFAGLIVVFLFLYLTLSKAEIEIWPETEMLNLETSLTVAETASGAGSILGEIFEKERKTTESFPSSGKTATEKKAEGTIRVYNEYSTSPQILIATTRFVSDNGKLFRTPVRVTVPGGTYQGGKLVAGEIDVKVVADESGEDYNIGPSTFSIPGFAGTDRYTKFYAKSFQSMEGGFSAEVSQVTAEDLEQAKLTMEKEVKSESENLFINELKSEKFSSFIFLSEAVQTEIIESASLAKAGDALANFNYEVTTRSKTLIFKKEDLENFVKDFILSQIPLEKKIHEESLKIDLDSDSIDLASGKIILNLTVSVKIYSEVDSFTLKKGLMGKSLLETKVFLEDQPKITKVRVEFWPFWVKKVPEDVEKIEIILNIDPPPILP